MMITHALLSPTFGMHQYTAHLVGRAGSEMGLDTRVVTTSASPCDRYDARVAISTPVACQTTGFAREGLDAAAYRRVLAALVDADNDGPVHFTGVHLWNVALVHALRRRGVPVIHTLHDLTPHSDARRSSLIRLWNRLVIASSATLLVHSECCRRELIGRGVPPPRVACAPLTHGFWSPACAAAVAAVAERSRATRTGPPLALFFGRVERYKGVDTLLAAWELAQRRGADGRLIVAGRVSTGVALPNATRRAELRDRRIGDDEALDLFAQADLLVLPYRDATQSALVAAAGAFGLPCLVTHAGALAEYVVDGETGWVVPPGDPVALAMGLAEALSDRARLLRMGEAARERRQVMLTRELEVLRALYTAAQVPVTRRNHHAGSAQGPVHG